MISPLSAARRFDWIEAYWSLIIEWELLVGVFLVDTFNLAIAAEASNCQLFTVFDDGSGI